MNGIEELIGKALTKDMKLTFDIKPYQPHAFLVVLEKSKTEVKAEYCHQIELKFNTRVSCFDSDKRMGEFDNLGHSIPAELLTTQIESEGVIFKIQKENNDALIPNGDTIQLPKCSHFNAIRSETRKPQKLPKAIKRDIL